MHLFRPATCLRLCTRAGSWLPSWAELKPFHRCRKFRWIMQNSGLTAPVWSLDQQPREPTRNANPSPSESARKEGQGSHPALGLGVLQGLWMAWAYDPSCDRRSEPHHVLRTVPTPACAWPVSLTVSACPGAGSEI